MALATITVLLLSVLSSTSHIPFVAVREVSAVVSISLYGGRCTVSVRETWMSMVSMVPWSVLAVHKAIDVPLLVKCNSFFAKSMMNLCISKKSSPRIASLPVPQPQLHSWKMSPQQ